LHSRESPQPRSSTGSSHAARLGGRNGWQRRQRPQCRPTSHLSGFSWALAADRWLRTRVAHCFCPSLHLKDLSRYGSKEPEHKTETNQHPCCVAYRALDLYHPPRFDAGLGTGVWAHDRAIANLPPFRVRPPADQSRRSDARHSRDAPLRQRQTDARLADGRAEGLNGSQAIS